MEIVINFPDINSSPLVLMWWFFKTIGWIFPVCLFILGLIYGWLNYIRNRYRASRKYILLAIDVPKLNEQTPKAVENIFNHLAGAHQPIDFYNKWWEGEINNSFSLEIVSLGGYVQFIIHTMEEYRDLIEAMIYAQYPDAEITEVEDYTKKWDIRFPNDKYNLWGTELELKKNQYYPIRTYTEFEDKVSKEAYKDSMAALLESMTRIGPGEEVWVQFVITAADNDWFEGAQSTINKIIGASSSEGKGIFKGIGNLIGYFFDSIVSSPESAKSGGKDAPNQMLYLTPGQKDVLAAIERKTGKIGYHTTMRLIYIAEKDKFKSKIPNNVYGSIKQFNTYDLNSIKPKNVTLTGGIVLFKKLRVAWRRNKILFQYKSRGHWLEPGTYGKILNTEELATLYHFPVAIVKTPSVQRTESKKSQPPISLPVEESTIITDQTEHDTQAAPPDNLPV